MLVVRLPANSGYYELSLGESGYMWAFNCVGVQLLPPRVVQGSTVQPKYSPNQTPHLKPKFLPSPHFQAFGKEKELCEITVQLLKTL